MVEAPQTLNGFQTQQLQKASEMLKDVVKLVAVDGMRGAEAALADVISSAADEVMSYQEVKE